MNRFSFVLCIALLAAAVFAEDYTYTYLANDWLKVTRFVSVGEGSGCTSITGACSATGALLPSYLGGKTGPMTSVFLTFENIGSVDRKQVQLTESIVHVPEGAKVKFDPEPPYNDGRMATWIADNLQKGGEFSVGYEYNAKAAESALEKIPKISVKTATENVVLSTPQSAKVGGRVSVSAKTESGQPVSGAIITVTYPDGTNQYAKTDAKGVAAFTANKEGFYTYSIDGYALVKLASTEALPEGIPAAAAAAVASDSGMLSSLTGLLPILAGIFVIAVVALMAYNFFTSKKEEEYYYPPTQPPATQAQRPSPQPPQPSGAVYSQQYSFGSKAADEKHYASQPAQPSIREQQTAQPQSQAPQLAQQIARQQAQGARQSVQPSAARPSVQATAQSASTSQSYQEKTAQPESRVLHGMPPVITRPSDLNRGHSNYSEKTSRDDDVERDLANLERKAREEGESTNSEQEIESAIAELEAIRQKLRERKDQMDSISSRMTAGGKKERGGSEDGELGAEDSGNEADDGNGPSRQPAKKATYGKKQPAPRVLPPKGRKLKLATHGVRRK